MFVYFSSSSLARRVVNFRRKNMFVNRDSNSIVEFVLRCNWNDDSGLILYLYFSQLMEGKQEQEEEDVFTNKK